MNILDKKSFSERLLNAYSRKGFDVKKHGFLALLSERYQVSKQTPSDWFDENKGYPRLEMLTLIADDLDVSLDYLLLGTRASNVIEIPILTANAAVQTFLHGEDVNAEGWIPALYGVKNAFALKLQDDSMTTNEGKSFAEGTIVVFERQKISPESGDLVFAAVNGQMGIFARYINHVGKEYLSLLNKRYENINEPFEVVAAYSYCVSR